MTLMTETCSHGTSWREVCVECDAMTKSSRAKDVQEGGDHYRSLPFQPIDYITKNGLGFCEGNVVKYISRWRAKGGVEDLRKARHYIDLLIESVEQ